MEIDLHNGVSENRYRKWNKTLGRVVRMPDNGNVVTFFSQISLQKLKVIVILITSTHTAR